MLIKKRKKKSLIEYETRISIENCNRFYPHSPPLSLNRSRIIFSPKFRNTILLTHLFLPDHFRMELGEELARYRDVITLSQRYLLRNDSCSGRGVFLLIRNTPNNKGNWWFREGGREIISITIERGVQWN